MVESFESSGNVKILHWVCSKQRHKEGRYHYHMAIKLDRCCRWEQSKNTLRMEHGISVHYSNLHYNHYSAWKYVTKEDKEVVESSQHPLFWNTQPPRTSMEERRMEEKKHQHPILIVQGLVETLKKRARRKEKGKDYQHLISQK